MKLIDTHSHIFLDQFDNDRDTIIQSALDKGVKKIILPNVDSSTMQAMLNLCTKYPDICLPVVGLHPTSVKENYEDEMTIIEQTLAQSEFKFYGIGEIGIDLYWDKTFFEQQKEAFARQIRLASKYDLPIVIHARESLDEIFKILEQEYYSGLTGVFHSFSGTIEQANRATDFGFKLGINGIVTFKNSGLDKVVNQIDMKHLVLETDSPYLAPVPYRGKRNESSYVYHIAAKIAEIKNLAIENVAAVTTKNAISLFNIV